VKLRAVGEIHRGMIGTLISAKESDRFMEKTRIGVSVGLMGAALYLAGMAGGVLAFLVLAGYVLLFEKNAWLRRTAIQAGVIVFSFMIAGALIDLIPSLASGLTNLVGIFGGHLTIRPLSSLGGLLGNILSIARILLFVALALRALKQQSMPIAQADKLVNDHYAYAPENINAEEYTLSN